MLIEILIHGEMIIFISDKFYKIIIITPVRCMSSTEYRKYINHGHYQSSMLFEVYEFKLIVNV
jgi:hypothetical protein